jgi:hypothetical protein
MGGRDIGGRDTNAPDVLQSAAAALRTAHDGQREGSGFTRARILATVAERRRPRLRRWLVLAPFGSALLVGSAWAQSTGSWPRVWQAVATVLPFVQPAPQQALERRHRSPTTTPPEPPPISPAPAEQAAPEAAPIAAEPAAPIVAEPAPIVTEPAPKSAPTRSTGPASTSRTRRSTPSTPSEAPAPDPELRRFRAAHELHVQGQSRAAIAAYEEYLQAYPQGRFVPEARYNSALDSIKVGDHDSARRLLEPFAAGTYGGYRRAEAQRLLEALHDGGSR